MNIITHALTGWCLGRQVSEQPADASLIFFASVIPDIDSLGIIADLYTGSEAIWFSRLHHKLGHNIFLALAFLPLLWYLARNWRIVGWCVFAFHFHLFCDIVGARGPDGYQWPVFYVFPLNDYALSWQGQWEINAWPNIAFTIFLLLVFLWQSARTGFSPLGFFSEKADRAFVFTLKKWFKMNEVS
jgi:hypothetical protein